MTTIRRTAIFLILWALALPTAVGYGQSGETKAKRSGKLEGSWALSVTPIVPPGVPPVPPFVTYITVSSGGALVGTDRTRPFANLQHGSWERTGPGEYMATQVQDTFDPAGVFLGVFTVRQKITLTGPDTFVGVANALFVNPAGELVFERCATTQGSRITPQEFTLCEDVALPE
jgi:hypothetical protein